MKTNSFLIFIMCIISFSLMGQTNKSNFHFKGQTNELQNEHRTPLNHEIRLLETENHIRNAEKIVSQPRIHQTKSILTVKPRLDSVIWEYYYDVSGQFVNSEKETYTYDANGNVTQYIYYTTNEITSQWQPSEKEESTYDANGNMTLYIDYDWKETTSQWQPSDKDEYTYDANGNNTLYIDYDWNETTSQWQPSYKYEYTYDANGNNTLYIYYEWNETSSQWLLNYKVEYTYDANGNNTLYICYEWNETTSQWQPNYKYEYTYDVNGNITLYIYYSWNETTSQWQPYYKYEYTYDVNGNNTLDIGYSWSETSSQWLPYHKSEYTYDANGNNTLYIYYNWSETSSQWLPYYKGEYTFDNSFSYDDLILPPDWDEEYLFNHMLLTAISYDWDVNTSSFINDSRITLYYSEQNTSVAIITEPGIKIYPNPATETLYIVSSTKINSISIYDISGKLILTQEGIDKTCEIALLDIKSGIYLIEISSDNKTVIQKLVKE